ncbi:hypothetical protein ACO0SA_000898 [Hanseniaspora valbyensis]
MSTISNNGTNIMGSSKKKKIDPTTVISAVKSINPDSAIINISINSSNNNPKTNDNTVNYNIKNLLSEERNLVLDYTQLLSSEHQQQHLLQQLQEQQDADEDDAAEPESDEDENDDDSVEVSSDNEEKQPSEIVPKKRVSKFKGKAMVGKYDLEDPFIDDREDLLEENKQKAGEGVGFFVFFGEFDSKDIQK